MPRKVSFCTTCKGRLYHLRETLPKNIQDNLDYPLAEFVVLDFDSGDGLSEWIRPLCDKYSNLSYYSIVDSVHPTTIFFNSYVKNICTLLGQGDIVCNVDADNFTGKGFALFLDKAIANPKTVAIGKDDTTGRIACFKSLFVSLGGYDERFGYGWGYEDNDFYSRALGLGCDYVWLPPQFLGHVPHSDWDRVRLRGELPKDKSQQIHEEMSRLSIEKGELQANSGKVWGKATVLKNFSTKSIAISSHEWFIQKWYL